MQVETKARIKGDITFTSNGKQIITLECSEDLRPCFDELNGKDLTLLLKPFHKKRSRDANSYLWALIHELAETMNLSPIEIYKQAIKNKGQYRDMTVDTKAVDTLIQAWGKLGLGWFAERVDECAEGWIVRCYYGSSEYSGKVFSRVLDDIIQDCEAVGIPTATKTEIEEMMSRWEKRAPSAERTEQ